MGQHRPQNSLSQRREKRQINVSIATKRMFSSYYIPFKSPHFLYSFEFGGPWGVFAIMTGFPILMYYLWICLWFYDGKLVYPTSVDDIQPFLWRMWGHIAKAGYLLECKIYISF
jgi:hypothetical protein